VGALGPLIAQEASAPEKGNTSNHTQHQGRSIEQTTMGSISKTKLSLNFVGNISKTKLSLNLVGNISETKLSLNFVCLSGVGRMAGRGLG
jgi:hypothetical protein